MTNGGIGDAAPGGVGADAPDDAAGELARLRGRVAALEEELSRVAADTALEVERARAQADLASRAKSAFLANMSHEIRTPLAAVMGYANLIAYSEHSHPETRDWGRRLRRSAEHLLALLDDVLDLAKIEAGRLDLHLVACDPAEVLEEIGVLMEPRAQEKGLILTVEADTELPAQLRTDPLRLKQILANLVGNAIKYTEQGEVAVHARLRMSPVGRTFERWLELEVVDTGVGIAREDLDRLFLPFEQARSRPRAGGVGLGLDIAQRLARLLGGDVTARSEVGVGSAFTVTLPVDAGADRQTTPARLVTRSGVLATEPEVARLDGCRVLVVDDAEDNRLILSHFLGNAGADVSGVASIAEAEAALIGDPSAIDVVVTDLSLADGDGLTLVRRMAERGDRRPVLALTADAMLETRERALAAGVTDFLVKPVVAWRLVSRVAALPTVPRPLAVKPILTAGETPPPPSPDTGAARRAVVPSGVVRRTDGGIENSPSRPSSRPALRRVPTSPSGVPLTPPPAPPRDGPAHEPARDPQRVPTAPSARPQIAEVVVRADVNGDGPDTARERRPQIGRPDVPDELLERFYAVLQERVYALEEGLSVREASRLRDIGHRVAGSGATMGHPELTEHGRRVERAVASGAEWDEVATRARELLEAAREAAATRRWLG